MKSEVVVVFLVLLIGLFAAMAVCFDGAEVRDRCEQHDGVLVCGHYGCTCFRKDAVIK